MALRIRHIAHRFALLLALAAVVPLVAYGVISIWSLQRGTRASITTGNENVATRAAEEIRRYVVGNAGLLKALAADLQNTGLEAWQQDRILKNYVLEFREFREITLFDEGGAIIASSRVGKPRVSFRESVSPPAVDTTIAWIRSPAPNSRAPSAFLSSAMSIEASPLPPTLTSATSGPILTIVPSTV